MFQKFKLSDIRAAVRRKLDDPDFSTDDIDAAANDYQNYLLTNNKFRFMEKSETLSVGDGDYELEMPKDYMSLINMTVLDTATSSRVITKDYLDYSEFMAGFANYATATSSKLSKWTDFANGIRFSAPADASYDIIVDYYRVPKTMTLATDNCEFPITHRELMVLGTLYRVMRINEDYEESSAELRHLEKLEQAFIKNYGRGSFKTGARVIKTNRVRRGELFSIQGY